MNNAALAMSIVAMNMSLANFSSGKTIELGTALWIIGIAVFIGVIAIAIAWWVTR